MVARWEGNGSSGYCETYDVSVEIAPNQRSVPDIGYDKESVWL